MPKKKYITEGDEKPQRVITKKPKNKVSNTTQRLTSYDRQLGEYRDLSQNIFQRSRDIANSLQQLHFSTQESLAQFMQKLREERQRQQELDFEMKKRIGEKELSMLPTAWDQRFSALMDIGTTTGTSYLSKRAMDDYYQKQIDLYSNALNHDLLSINI